MKTERKSIETDHGTVQYKEIVSPEKGGFQDSTRELTLDERQRLHDYSTRLEPFVAKYVSRDEMDQDRLENLDLAFAVWLASDDPEKENAADVESLLGTALGEYCIEQFGLTWMVVTDKHGSEIALVGENPPTRAHVFSSIRYRIEDRKTDFICALFESLRHQREHAAKE